MAMRKLLLTIFLFGYLFSSAQTPMHWLVGKKSGCNYDVDACAFITAAGITDLTQKEAINTLVVQLKDSSLWSLFYAIYPMVGGTSTSMKYNLKSPFDADTSFRIGWGPNWTFSATGATPTIPAAAETYLNVSTNLIQDNTAISYYSRTNVSGTQIDMGVYGTGIYRLALAIAYSGQLQFDAYNYNTGRVAVSNSNTTGFYIGSRTDATTEFVFKNGSQFGTTNTGASGSISNINATISLGYGGGGHYSSKECAFASIGKGLTTSQCTAFSTIVNAYETALSRNVY